MILSFVSDAAKHRLGYALFAQLLAIIGLAILITVHNDRNLEYAALFVSQGNFLPLAKNNPN